MRSTALNPSRLFLLILPVSAWVNSNCDLRDQEYGVEDLWVEGYLVECIRVKSIEEDLAGLPRSLTSLSIQLDPSHDGAIHLGVFSQFPNLEDLVISGCLTQIHPTGNGIGFPSLRSLLLNGNPQSCQGVFNRRSFSDMTNLKSFQVYDYTLSVMSHDVFDDMVSLQFAAFYDYLMQDLSDVACRLRKTRSLTHLLIESEITLVKQINCSGLNGSKMIEPVVFQNLTSVRLQLGKVTLIEDGALAWLPKLSYLSAYITMSMLTLLPLSGIKQVEHLDCLELEEVFGSEYFCPVVEMLAIRKLTFSNPLINVETCIGLQYIGIKSWDGVLSEINIEFIFHLKNLTILDVVGHYHLGDICKLHPMPIPWLIQLKLGVNLTSLVANQFSCLKNLQHLSLSYSSISNIDPFAFQGLSELVSLKLDNNKIKMISVNTFSDLHQLTTLDLRENILMEIETCSFRSLLSLRTVWLGDLNYHSASTDPVIKINLTDIFENTLSQLEFLSISSGMRPMLLTIGSNMTSNQKVSLHLKGKTVSFEDCQRPFLKSVINLYVDTEQFLCGAMFMGRFFRSLETLEYVSMLSAKSVDMTDLNQLVHLRTLILTQVDLSKQEFINTMFHNLTKLEILRMRNCRINSLDGSLTRDLQALNMFKIHIPNVYNIFQNFIEPLSSLKTLSVFNFNVFCSCDNVWFLQWAQRQKQVHVLLDTNPKDFTCLSDNGMDHLNLVAYSREKCQNDVGYILFLVTGQGVLIFMLVAFFCHFASPYVLPLYHITLGWLAEARHTDGRRRYRYDAFVSYSGKDERWVVEELLPNLEQRGPPFLRLCLHGRDFQVGKDIVENITDSMYQSRHTLCLVSRRFLRSSWCSLEMQLATCRLKAEHRDVLILVFLETISPRLLSAHHRLARLMKSRTYLDWPQEPQQHGAFWDRLWDKLRPEG